MVDSPILDNQVIGNSYLRTSDIPIPRSVSLLASHFTRTAMHEIGRAHV